MKKCLLILLAFLVSCASLTYFEHDDFYAVWNASIATAKDWNLEITLSDKESGLLKARPSAELWKKGEKFTYTIQVKENGGKVFIDVNVDLPPLHGRASKWATRKASYAKRFIDDVKKKLEE